jgi:hypothetical protein
MFRGAPRVYASIVGIATTLRGYALMEMPVSGATTIRSSSSRGQR